MSIPGAKGFDTNCGYVAHDGTATSVGLSQIIVWLNQNIMTVKTKIITLDN